MKHAFLIVLAACTWGMISIYINVMQMAGLTSMQCVALRTIFSAPMLLLVLLLTDRTKLKIRLRDLPVFAGTGVCSMVFFNFCYFQCIQMVGGAAVPALLLYTAPAMVMIMSAIFFKEKITSKKILALILTFLGLGIVTGAFGGGETLSGPALLLGLGSAFGYALYSIFGKLVTDRYSPLTITFYTFVMAAAAAIPSSGIFSNIQLLADKKILLTTAALALFATLIPYLAYTAGLKGMEAGRASVIACAEPAVAAVCGILFFHEQFTQSKALGMVLILSAILFLNLHVPARRVSAHAAQH